MSEELSPALRAWAAKAVIYREENIQPLQMTDVTSPVDPIELHEVAQCCRQDLEDELRRCVGWELDFKVGKMAWGHLVGRRGGLQDLLRAVEQSDVKEVHASLGTHPYERPEVLLDEAVTSVTGGGRGRSTAIIADRRRQCLDHLAKVAKLSARWIEAAARETAPPRGAPKGVVALREGLLCDLVAIDSEILRLLAERAYPGPLMKSLRERLNSVVRLVQ